MGKVTVEGWQTDASNAGQPTGSLILRRGRLENYKASDERQNEVARNYGGDVVICLTVPSPAEDKRPRKPK